MQIKLSEYREGNKTATVFKTAEGYLAQGSQDTVIKVSETFPTEQEAEDFAEDWVLLTTPE